MLLIYPPKKKEPATAEYVPVPATSQAASLGPAQPAEPVRPDDWPFMEQSGKVLDKLPATWAAYPETEAGMLGIIDMEHNELKKAVITEDKMRELVHLASACLHYWRHLHAAL